MKNIRKPLALACAAAILWPSLGLGAEWASVRFKSMRGLCRKDNMPAVVGWVETKAGQYVATFFMNDPAAQWLKKHKDKPLFQRWKPRPLKIAKTDAVTKATSSVFGTVKTSWDIKDDKGKLVPNGDYIVKLESAIQGPANAKFAQVTSLPITLGGSKTFFNKPTTKYLDGRRTRKSAIYIRRLAVELRD